jgi:nucleotide-binding universal stress UspA family protein
MSRENGKVRHLLKDVIGKLEAEGARASGEVRLVHNGNTVAVSLAWVAISAKADLVAVGSRGRTDLGGLFLGSVSQRVAAGLDLPLIVMRTSPDLRLPPRSVMVGTDGLARSEE